MTEFNGLSWTRLSTHKTLISALPLTCITKVTHTPLLSTDNFTCAAQIQQTKDFFSPCLHCAISLFSRALHLSYSFTPIEESL